MKRAILILLSAAVLRGQVVVVSPSAPSVENAASGALATFPGQSLVPGELFTVSTILSGFLFSLPQSSGGIVQVQHVGGAALQLPLVDSGLLQITARLPESFPLGPADVTLLLPGEPPSTARVQVQSSNLGLFRKWNATPGPGVSQNVAMDGSVIANSLTHPALPGQYVTLWGTGLGTATAQGLFVRMGDRRVPASYAGHSAAFPGLDQINFALPADSIQTGCYVPLSVEGRNDAGTSWVTNQITISIAQKAGSCTHPLGLPASAQAQLDAGGYVLYGRGGLNSSNSPQVESAYLDIRQADAATIDFDSAPLGVADWFGCVALSRPSSLFASFIIVPGEASVGPSVTLLDPHGQTYILPSDDGYSFFSLLFPQGNASLSPGIASNFLPGEWHLQVPGGADVTPFQFAFPEPPPIALKNSGQLQRIDVSNDLTIAWDAKGFLGADVMTITLSSLTTLQYDVSLDTGVTCRIPASQGSVTIPSGLLASVPDAHYASTRLTLGLSRRNDSPITFTMPNLDKTAGWGVMTPGRQMSLTVQLTGTR